MSQACSQHPALAGRLAYRGAEIERGLEAVALICRHGSMLLPLRAQGPALDADDPLPPLHDRLCLTTNLEQLYRDERPGLLRYLARYTSIDIAHDAVQQVFARLAAGRGNTFEMIASPRAYLRAAVTNAIKNEARSVARHQRVSQVAFTDVAGPDPVACLEARDRLDRLEQAVRQLKPLTRQVFLARRLDGYSYAEIAERTGLSERGVEKQMRIALHKLGRHLRRDE